MRSAITKITAAILAGGKSRRFGSNKALARVNGIPIIQHIRNQLYVSVRRIIVITNTHDEFAFLDLPMYRDIFPGRGPLGGLHTAMEVACSPWIFVTSCDLPYFSYNLLTVLARCIQNVEAVCFTKAGKTEPFPALFNTRILAKLKLYMKSRDYTFQSFLNNCNMVHVPLENVLSEIDPRMLLNCNTLGDYRNIVTNLINS